MPRLLKTAAGLSILLSAVFSLLFQFRERDLYLTLAVTFGTTGYHLGMRLLIGFLYQAGMKNRADYTKPWFTARPWEARVYQFLRVKSWKGKLPTYASESFSSKLHTWDEIAQAMCQSELVHETIILFSFVPLIFSKWFGSFPAFLITSIGGAAFDLLFVIIQRYNRPRILRLAARQKRKEGG